MREEQNDLGRLSSFACLKMNEEWSKKLNTSAPLFLGRKLMPKIHTRLIALKVRYEVYQMLEDTMSYSHAQASQISSTS